MTPKLPAARTAARTPAPARESKSRPPAAAVARRKLGVGASTPAALLADLRLLIAATRQTVAQGVNSALVLLYWQIGQRVQTDILGQKRAEYGEQIVHAVSAI